MNADPSLLGRVLPATVHVHATIPSAHASAPILGEERMGTGTVIDDSGLVLTVSYVVIGAERLQVTTLDGETQPAELLKYDFASGLAVLQLPERRPASVPIRRTQDLRCGDLAFIVASVGENAVRVADGVISYIGPFDANWEYVVERGLMTSAMNPGLGGGPLLDARGRLLGIVSLNLSEIGKFTFAVPSDYFLDQQSAFLANDGTTTLGAHAWLGVFCYQLSEHVVISGILDDGPGARAGLKAGDVVLAVDELEIADRATLYRHLLRRQPGDAVQLRIFREDSMRTMTVAVGDVAAYFA